VKPAGKPNLAAAPIPWEPQGLITGAVVNMLEQKQCLYGDFTKKHRENKHKPGDVARNGPRKAGTSGNDLDRHHGPTSQGRGSKGGCGAALRGAAQICPPVAVMWALLLAPQLGTKIWRWLGSFHLPRLPLRVA
jgi:hypothetical protein